MKSLNELMSDFERGLGDIERMRMAEVSRLALLAKEKDELNIKLKSEIEDARKNGVLLEESLNVKINEVETLKNQLRLEYAELDKMKLAVKSDLKLSIENRQNAESLVVKGLQQYEKNKTIEKGLLGKQTELEQAIYSYKLKNEDLDRKIKQADDRVAEYGIRFDKLMTKERINAEYKAELENRAEELKRIARGQSK